MYQGQGMTPTATGEYPAYPDSSTIDLDSTSAEQRPRAFRAPASVRFYKPFHMLLLVYLFFCKIVPMRRAALFTQMAVVITAVGAFFLSIAYGGIVIVAITISATLQGAVANKARQARLQASENPR